MEELRGPNIQIVLHIKKGLGFGFLKTPFIVSGSLNGYVLDTDPMVPCHEPDFDVELVWEADKRRFRNLRLQNVPIKLEAYSTSTQGKKDKVGYILLSLLSAVPCPANKVVDVKHSWTKLLGVRSEGKCCHPQLYLSLTIEDRMSIHTPRNELRMFHTNEVAYPTVPVLPVTSRSNTATINEYLQASKKSVSSEDLKPKLLCDQGLIQIGNNAHLFVLSFTIGSANQLRELYSETDGPENSECYISYSVFTHDIMTDRVQLINDNTTCMAQFNQKSSLRLSSDLKSLTRYFGECPLVVVKLCRDDRDLGICSIDVRKLIPTDDEQEFVHTFCNQQRALTINERCFFLPFDENANRDERKRSYVDVEISLCYVEPYEGVKPTQVLTARSATQLTQTQSDVITIDYKSGSCTELMQDNQVCDKAYTNITPSNTSRYRKATGAPSIETSEIADLIRTMCESFAISQERLLKEKAKPTTSDMQIQCEQIAEIQNVQEVGDLEKDQNLEEMRVVEENMDSPQEEVNLEMPKKPQVEYVDKETQALEKELVLAAIPLEKREELMKKYIEELEDWKEKQQELYKIQMQRKEEYYLETLSKEWAQRREQLEKKLSQGIEQCRTLAVDLSNATEDFKLRGFRNSERERKLTEAKQALEQHYTLKYQELREASIKMEQDMNHKLKVKDMRIEELECRTMQLERQIDVIKLNMKNNEREAEIKYSDLSKEKTDSLVQELRFLEEKLDSAVQSKQFFKEQWGRAVRELHVMKLNSRKDILSQVRNDKTYLKDLGVDLNQCGDSNDLNNIELKINDYYQDVVGSTANIDSETFVGNTDEKDDSYHNLLYQTHNPMRDKLSQLIEQRESLVKSDNPDEELLKRLNKEIRSMLLSCGL